MAERIVSHAVIVEYFREIARAHVGINGFYRFNWNEINNALRRGISSPTLLLESHDSDVRANENQVATFNDRTISFLIIDFAKLDDYDKQEEILDTLEKIGLDIGALLNRDRKDKDHWLWGNYNGNFKMQKVGPVFDNRWGWNIVFTVTNKEPMKFDESKWNFDAESV